MEIPISKAREQLSDLINKVAFGKEQFILSRRGKPLAALVPIDEGEEKNRKTRKKEKYRTRRK